MKKIIFSLLLVPLSLGAACLIAYVATPALVAASTMFKGVSLATNALGIPHWIGLLLEFSLLPTGVIMAVRAFSPKFRRLAVIAFTILAVAYTLVAATTNSKLLSAAHNALVSVQKICIPLKSADPTTETWFCPDGKSRLFYTRPTTNTWAFYLGAYPGAYDPVTGAELEPVTPSIRQEWQTDKECQKRAEVAKVEEAAATDMKEQQAAIELEKADDQRKRDETTKEEADEKTALENMKQQVADEQQKIEEQGQKIEMMSAAKVDQTRNEEEVAASEDDSVARNQQIVVANTEPRYWIIDGRGQEFGPVFIVQLQQWIAEGRVDAGTLVHGEGWQEWQPLSSILPCPVPVVYYRQYYRQPSYFVRFWR